mmetsp:Transcript_18920/g.40818  ORF Transcript_18920/g.40818 Transcript_18920/m.40818 type:complete len:222 (-) Transcript_18920:1498-2163(-)
MHGSRHAALRLRDRVVRAQGRVRGRARFLRDGRGEKSHGREGTMRAEEALGISSAGRASRGRGGEPGERSAHENERAGDPVQQELGRGRRVDGAERGGAGGDAGGLPARAQAAKRQVQGDAQVPVLRTADGEVPRAGDAAADGGRVQLALQAGQRRHLGGAGEPAPPKGAADGVREPRGVCARRPDGQVCRGGRRLPLRIGAKAGAAPRVRSRAARRSQEA